MDSPLNGVVVLDLSQLVQGPFATQIMGDMGADVIKVEPPAGDWLRRFAISNAYIKGESISFLSFNRNKRSVVVNAKTERGLDVIKELACQADVLVENFRPGVMERLGLGYETLADLNPRLVYCSSSGYGQDGPYATRPGQDLLIQSITGLPLLNGRRDDPPIPVGVGVADLTAGLHIVYGVLAALIQRSTTGKGQRVEVSLLNSLLSIQMQEFTAHLNGFSAPGRHVAAASAPHVGPPFGIYATLDGFIALAMNPMDVIGPVLELPPQYCLADMNVDQDMEELYEAIANALLKRTTSDWLERLLAVDAWCAQVQDYNAVESDPQVMHSGIIRKYEHPLSGEIRTLGPPVEFSDSLNTIRRPPPVLGEHTSEVLTEVLAKNPDELTALISDEIVYQSV